MEYQAVPNFLAEQAAVPMVDVRSPAEYAEGHISGAVNIPLLDDQERAIVGTLYKQKGQEAAVAKGYELVSPRRPQLIERAQSLAKQNGLRIYCWRGGMRSEKMAALFESVGIPCTVLEGGYKAFRSQFRRDLEKMTKLLVLSGMTGTGKTALLQGLHRYGEQVLDLECLANHRGSAFGSIGLGEQPTTAQFHNELYQVLRGFDLSKRIWLEAESFSIGQVQLPETLWEKMLDAPTIEVELSRELRLSRLVADYGHWNQAELIASIEKIKRRLGGKETETLIQLLKAGNLIQVAEGLLKYYDRSYHNSFKRFHPRQIEHVYFSEWDIDQHVDSLLQLADNMYPGG